MQNGRVIKSAKVWRKIGKRSQQVATLTPGTLVSGSKRDGKLFDIVSPVNGYTKIQWLKLGPVVVPPPPVEPPPSSHFIGWRCLHAREGGLDNPPNMPNVRRAKDAQPVKFMPALQRLAYDVMLAKNPTITRGDFASVFDSGTAFTNRHGLETDDPKLMDGIICAGMFAQFEQDGEYLIARPGVHAVDANQPLPTAQQVLDRGWYFVATTGQGDDGAANFPQGNGGPVYIVYALVEPVRYPAVWFAQWNSDRLPNPLKYGG